MISKELVRNFETKLVVAVDFAHLFVAVVVVVVVEREVEGAMVSLLNLNEPCLRLLIQNSVSRD